MRTSILFCLALLLAAMARGQSAATMTVQVNQPGAVVSSNLFGIFFEEISMAGDGGIYAELVRNRLFEDSTTPVWWTLTTNGSATGSWSIDTSLPLNPTNTQALMLTMTGGTGQNVFAFVGDAGGTHIITNFVSGQDQLYLEGYSLNYLKTHGDISVNSATHTTTITLDGGSTIIELKGITSLSASDITKHKP